MKMDWVAYMVRCSDGTLYTGATNDLAKRLREHNEGGRGAKYTKGRRPVVLVREEAFTTRSEALRREAEIKSMTRAGKERLLTTPIDKKAKKVYTNRVSKSQ